MPFTILFLLLSVLSPNLGKAAPPGPETFTRWTMVNVTPGEGPADCHLVEMPDGGKVLIDAGDAWDSLGLCVGRLRRLGVHHLDLVVLTHFHYDHYRALRDILQAGIIVDRVALNVPNTASAKLEIPWGCNLADVAALLDELRSRHIPYFTPKAGDSLYATATSDGTIAGIDVIAAFDGLHSPLGLTDVNDTSIILRLYHGNTRALFAGDMNQALGTYLAHSDLDLRADLLKAPHHGTDGVAPNAFYDKVHSGAMLVPSPTKLWRSPRSKRTRNYCIEHKIPFYVSGPRGQVTATMTAQGYSVETER